MISNNEKTRAGNVYSSPLCEVLDVNVEERILQASVEPVSIEDWDMKNGISLDF